MVDSTRLLRHVRENPALLRTNVELFLAELAELGSVKPTIATFGSEAHRLVQENVPADKYSQLGRLVHYAHRISKENYRESVLTVFGQLASDI